MKLWLLLLPLTLLAQPEIIQLRYGPPLPQVEGVSYCATNAAPIFVEFPDQTTPDGIISETVSINVSATISLTFTNVTTTNTYAIYSCPVLVFPRGEFGAWSTNCTNCFDPPPKEPSTWFRSSLWLTATGPSLSWTQSFSDGQRFFKVVER